MLTSITFPGSGPTFPVIRENAVTIGTEDQIRNGVLVNVVDGCKPLACNRVSDMSDTTLTTSCQPGSVGAEGDGREG